MLRWFLADLRTGRQILDLNVKSGRWERFLNAPERLSATVTLRDPANIALRLRFTSVPARTILAVAYGDTILAAGIVWARSYQMDTRALQLSARGIWSYYDHRYILPTIAATTPVSQFTIPDPDDSTKTIPNPALTTSYSGFELGTIAKKLVQQAHAWTGGALPVVFETDRTATADEDHTRNYVGAEFKNLGTVLEQLSEVDGGPDITFKPRFTADRLGVEFELRTGTEADPQLHGGTTHSWYYGTPKSPLSNLQFDEDATDRTGLAWFTGGRSADKVLVARSQDNRLVGEGFPLLELLDSSHSSVETQSTLDRWAVEATRFGYGAVEEMSFDVRTIEQPMLGTYWEGDWVDVTFPRYRAEADPVRSELVEEITLDPDGYEAISPSSLDAELYSDLATPMQEDLMGDPYLYEGGTMRRRIVGMSGDHTGDVVNITTAPERI